MRYFKLRKIIASLLIATSVLAINPIGASAEWKSDNIGWWYTEGNSYATGWKQIDGKWYCFTLNGYMLHDITVNGYTFGSDGVWINGQAQTQKISVEYPSSWTKETINGIEYHFLDNKRSKLSLSSESLNGYTEEDYIKTCISKRKSRFGVKNIEVSDEMFNNIKGKILHYYITYNNTNVSIYEAFFTYNNTAYMFLLVGDEKDNETNLQDFKNLLNTLKVEN